MALDARGAAAEDSDQFAVLIADLDVVHAAAAALVPSMAGGGQQVAQMGGGEEIDIDYLRPPVEKFATIKAAFQASGGTALSPVHAMLGERFSYEELRIARLFIKSSMLNLGGRS